MADKKVMSFEEGMETLEKLVKRMEQGEMPLEETFEAYEQAKALLNQLSGMLDAGEARMVELTKQGERALTLES